jgi:hypothetical protein
MPTTGTLHEILHSFQQETTKRSAKEASNGSNISSSNMIAAAVPLLLARASKRQRTGPLYPALSSDDQKSSAAATATTAADAAVTEKVTDNAQPPDAILEWQTSKRCIAELAHVYCFGLQSVAALQDLRAAPDAILPGNFVPDNSE